MTALNAEERTLNTMRVIMVVDAAAGLRCWPTWCCPWRCTGGILADFLTPPKETAVALAGAQAAARTKLLNP